jgi:hypothetical protein
MSKRWAGRTISREESLLLLNEMAKWCRKTGTNYNKLVGEARVAPSFRSYLRSNRRECVSVEVAGRIRDAMKRNPHGLKEPNYHGRSCSAVANSQPAPVVEIVRVNRDPCFRCGVPADRGCEHSLSASAHSVRMMR